MPKPPDFDPEQLAAALLPGPTDTPALDRAHVDAILAVLTTLQGLSTAHAALACEDAYATVCMGARMGLTMPQIVAYVHDVHDNEFRIKRH